MKPVATLLFVILLACNDQKQSSADILQHKADSLQKLVDSLTLPANNAVMVPRFVIDTLRHDHLPGRKYALYDRLKDRYVLSYWRNDETADTSATVYVSGGAMYMSSGKSFLYQNGRDLCAIQSLLDTVLKYETK
jgi:hypothetical protein